MLTSIRSPRIQAVRRLHRRAERLTAGRFLVEGPQAVREALDGLLELYVTDPAAPLALEAAGRGVEVLPVSDAVLAAIAETRTPQGLVGVAGLLDTPLDEAVGQASRLVTVLHQVGDPGNAGTVIRASDAAGADAVILTEGSVDPHNGKCVRASAGSLWHLPVVAGAALDELLPLLRRTGLQVLATSGEGSDDLDELADQRVLAVPTAWVFGNEAAGLPDDLLAAADRVVRIPIRGKAESLNLATAAAVCLYASARAQRALQ
ncbi:MAG: tRNA/rRNA methyltransferase (SpoU) [Frankiales bacterium]|nr:tRNA/rRNA methyltransferase (SpoU) [Frankiales bacterium]